MSILDGLPTAPDQMASATRTAEDLAAAFLAKARLSEKQQDMLDLVRRGIFLGEILDVSQEQKDALLAHGLGMIQLGEIQKGRDTLVQLFMLDPLEARAIYGIAVSYQLENQFDAAGKLFLHFLALDATNPEGHLRLGECFLGNQEPDNARSCFDAAKTLVARGYGTPAAAEHADRMLAVVAARAASA